MKRLVKILGSLLILSLIIGDAGCGQTPESETKSVVEDYYEALNNGDMEILDRLFTNDAVFSFPNVELTSRQDILAMHQGLIENNAKISYSDPQYVANTFKAIHTHRSEQLGPLTGTIEILVENGAIDRVSVTWDENTIEKIKRRGQAEVAEETPIELALAQDYYEALNNGDMETLESLFTSEAVFSFPSGEVIGRQEILAVHQRWIDRNSQFSYSDPQVEDNCFRCNHSQNNDQLGLLTGTIEIVVENEAIDRVAVMWDENAIEKILQHRSEAGIAEEPPIELSVAYDYHEALNKGDMETLESLFTSDAIFSFPHGEVIGRQEILNMHQRWIDNNVQISYSDPQCVANTFKAKHTFINTQSDLLTGTIEIIVDDGAIDRVTVIWDEYTVEKLRRRGQAESTEETPIELVLAQDYYEALNNGDMETLENLFTSEAVFSFPRGEVIGRQEILAVHQRWIDNNVQISYSDPQVEDNYFRGNHRQSNDQLGLLTGTIEIIMENETIAHIAIVWDEESMQKLNPPPEEEIAETPHGQGEEEATEEPPVQEDESTNTIRQGPYADAWVGTPLLPSEPEPLRQGSMLVMFDWSMPPRFGVDSNQDGRIDLPNTYAYVNPNKETLLTEGRGTISGPVEKIGPDIISRPRFMVTFEAIMPTTGYFTWKITGSNIDGAIEYEGTSPMWDVLLPEGIYEVTFSATDSETGKYGSITRRIPVEDILIVSIGDSYSSGEGNPENPRLETGWGEGYVETDVPRLWADDGEEGYSAIDEDHRRSHRSTLSWPAQAALAIERADPHTSVTFVSVASSGATISKGILGSYGGAEEDTWLDDAEPQIDQVAGLVGGRQIDVLTMSIGGNDIGFACILKQLVDNDPVTDPITYWSDLGWIWNATRTGNWDNFGCPNVAGLWNLDDEYWELNEAIHTRLNVFLTYIIEYPDPTKVRCGGEICYCNEILGDITWPFEVDVREQKGAIENVFNPLNDAIWAAAADHKWVPVGGIASAFADGHGYCADNPEEVPGYAPGNPYPNDDPWPYHSLSTTKWLRTAEESVVLQGPFSLLGILERMDTCGTMHPNELGHQKIKDLLLERLFLPVEVPGIGRIDTDDQISEAQVINIGSTIDGRLVETPDVNMYQITVNNANQRLIFEMQDAKIATWTRIFDAYGNQLADSQSSSFRLEYIFDRPGIYYIGVSGRNNRDYDAVTGLGDCDGWATGNYRLWVHG